MAELIPWLFILPPALVTVVALGALAWRSTRAGRARQHLMEGGRHLYQGQHDEAEAAFREGLKLRPDDLALQGTLASFLVAQERFDEARPLLDTVRAAQADDPRLTLVLGRCQQGQGELDAALETWASIGEDADVFLDACMAIGAVRLEQGDLPGAIEALERGSSAGTVHQRRPLKTELRLLKRVLKRVEDDETPLDEALKTERDAQPASRRGAAAGNARARGGRRGSRARRGRAAAAAPAPASGDDAEADDLASATAPATPRRGRARNASA